MDAERREAANEAALERSKAARRRIDAVVLLRYQGLSLRAIGAQVLDERGRPMGPDSVLLLLRVVGFERGGPGRRPAAGESLRRTVARYAREASHGQETR
jgi:hypothetical protein